MIDFFEQLLLSKTDNRIILMIVYFLWFLAIVWFLTFLRWIYAHFKVKRKLFALSDITPLNEARISSEEYDINHPQREKDLYKKFYKYIHERQLDYSNDIVILLRTLFIGGWKGNRLEVGELLQNTVAKIDASSSILKVLQNTFIIVGLLGTLVGLAVVIPELPNLIQDISGPSDSNSFSNFLNHLKSAFKPSIWGVMITVVTVICYAFVYRFYVQPIHIELEHTVLKQWVPELLPTSRELEKIQIQVSKNIETVSQAANTAEKVLQNVNKFEEILDKFDDDIESVSKLADEWKRKVSKLNQTADTFERIVNSQFAVFPEKFTQALDALNRTVTIMQESSCKTTESNQDLLKKQTEFMELHSKKLNELQDTFIEAVNEFRSSQSVITSFIDLAKCSVDDSNSGYSDALEKFLNQLTEINNSLTNGLNGIEEKIVSVLRPTYNELNDKLTQKLNEGGNKLTQTSEYVNNQIGAFHREAIHRINNALNENKKERNDLKEAISKLADLSKEISEGNAEIKDIVAKLPDAINQLVSALTKWEDTAKVLVEFSKNIKDVSTTMSSQIESLKLLQTQNNLNDIAQLKETIEKLNLAIDKLLKLNDKPKKRFFLRRLWS